MYMGNDVAGVSTKDKIKFGVSDSGKGIDVRENDKILGATHEFSKE